MRRLVTIGILLLIIGCTHEEVSERKTESEAPALPVRSASFLFHANRRLELEPCGCSLKPIGGIEREWNFTESVKKATPGPVLSFAAGTTFVPDTKDYHPKSQRFYEKKAGFVVSALNSLGLKALSPSANDFKHGVKFLKALQTQSKFVWLSSNIVDKKSKQPVFPTSLTFKEGADEYLVVGLSAAPEKAFASKEITVTPPREALKAILEEKTRTKKFVIVLSNLPQAEWDGMRDLERQVNLILGASDDEVTLTRWEQLGPSTLFANPSPRSKSYALLSLQWVMPIIGFHSPEFVEANGFRRRALEVTINEGEAELQRKLSKKVRKTWEEKVAAAKERLASAPDLSAEAKPGFAEVKSTILDLDSSFAEPKNTLSELLTQWQSEMRALAVKDKSSR